MNNNKCIFTNISIGDSDILICLVGLPIPKCKYQIYNYENSMDK